VTKWWDKILGGLSYVVGVLTQDYRKRAMKDYRTFSTMRRKLEDYYGELKGINVLDIGCGRRYPYTLLLHSLGNNVVGIDTAYIGDGFFIKRYWKEITRNGFKSFCRAFLFDVMRQKSTYYKTLQELCDFPLNKEGLTFKIMNAENVKSPNETFDLVVSILCFEHVANVPKVLSELYRVLKTGGFAYIKIHLFTSRTGGHHLGKQYNFVPPWDHLRQNRFPVPEYMNKLRKDEWLRLFSERFEIVEVLEEIDEKGERLLTSEILSELSDYSKEELLTETITIIARKGVPHSVP